MFNQATLRKWDTINQTDLAINKDITTFGVDTASFLIADMTNLERLIDTISYDDLVEALLSNQLNNYFDTVNQKLQNKGWAYVVSKGIGMTSEFKGDGFYIVA